MGKHSNVEWLNENSTRNYPLKEGAPRLGDSLTIPNNLLVDAQITGATRGQRYFISEINTSGNFLDIFISEFTFGQKLRFQINRTNHTRYKLYSPIQTFSLEVWGTIVVDNVDEVFSTLGNFGGSSFNGINSELSPRTLVWSDLPNRVSAVSVEGDATLLHGDVEFEAEVGTNLEFSIDVAQNKVLLGQVDPTPDPDCECPPNFPDIKTLNGSSADCNGNFEIKGQDVITVTTEGNSICIGSTISPNQICNIGGGGQPGPPGGPGPPGPPGPPGVCACPEIIIDSQCVETFVNFCEGDFVGIQICPEETFIKLDPTKPNEITQFVPFVAFGQLLGNSLVIKTILERLDEIGDFFGGEITIICQDVINCLESFSGTVSFDAGYCADYATNGAKVDLPLGGLNIGGVAMSRTALDMNDMMIGPNNLSEVSNPALAVSNIGAQASDPRLDDISGITGTSGNFLQWDGANLVLTAVPGGGDLLSTNNLSDVAVPATALVNLGGQASDPRLTDIAGISGTPGEVLQWDGANLVLASVGGGDLLAANNLSDVVSPATSLTNLGGQTTDPRLDDISGISGTPGEVLQWDGANLILAAGGSGDLVSTNNLSDVSVPATALANLGGQATDPRLDDISGITGTSGNFLQWDGANLVLTAVPGGGDLLSTNNLSDVAVPATARTNLGLAIGTDVQAWDTNLDTVAGFVHSGATDGQILTSDGADFSLEDPPNSLIPKPLVLSSSFAAAVNSGIQYVDLNTALGDVTATFPALPTDKDMLEFMITASPGFLITGREFILDPNGNSIILPGVSSTSAAAIGNATGTFVQLVYESANTSWRSTNFTVGPRAITIFGNSTVAAGTYVSAGLSGSTITLPDATTTSWDLPVFLSKNSGGSFITVAAAGGDLLELEGGVTSSTFDITDGEIIEFRSKPVSSRWLVFRRERKTQTVNATLISTTQSLTSNQQWRKIDISAAFNNITLTLPNSTVARDGDVVRAVVTETIGIGSSATVVAGAGTTIVGGSVALSVQGASAAFTYEAASNLWILFTTT